MSDWDAPDVQEWKEEARALQQDMFLRLGDREWDEWKKSDETILYRKVGFGLYSVPQYLPDGDNPGYSEEQFENIELVSDAILEKAKRGRVIHFACIFVFGKIRKNRFSIPVFKVKGSHDRTYFVDSSCRVYESWRDYLDSNRLPKCMYCYPRGGLYQGRKRVRLDFGTSPQCDLNSRIFSVLDTTATCVSFASTSLLAASLLTVPIAAPILVGAQATAAATGAYFACRSVTTLVDRGSHDQSIGLGDSESRMAWLGIVGCALGVAQGGIAKNITRAATAGDVASKALRITYNAVLLGSLTVGGLGSLNGFISLVDKADKGTLTPLDVYQYSVSILFYSNSVVNVRTARGIINKAQEQVLNQHCEDLTASQVDELFELADRVRGRTRMHRNANTIKAMNRIRDQEDFYASLVTDRSDL